MKEKFVLISFLIFVSVILSYGQSNSWKGLTPLHSTRADAEKLLGQQEKSIIPFRNKYKTENEKVTISYATKPCDDGWNVPKDTILGIRVQSSADSDMGKSFDDLKLDKSKFRYSNDDAMFALWTNSEEGLTYYFENIDSYLLEKGYIPKKSDYETLRCDGFPTYAPDQYYASYKYLYNNPKLNKKENLYAIFEQIDKTIILAKNEKNYKGYAMIYFSDKSSLKERQKRLSDIKNFLKLRKYSSDLITTIEGGLREESQVIFYLLPKDVLSPAPEPTLPSPQFMKNK